jgi:flagellar basal body-associated protein FliL
MAKPAATPTKGGKKKLIILVICALLATGSGAAVPMFLFGGSGHGDKPSTHEPKGGGHGQRAYVPFGDVVVNLSTPNLTRFLRVKILVVVDESMEKPLAELIQKNKPTLKNWLISHLADKSLEEVKGKANVNRLQREVWEEFNRQLFSDGSEKIRDIFFEEFVVQ